MVVHPSGIQATRYGKCHQESAGLCRGLLAVPGQLPSCVSGCTVR